MSIGKRTLFILPPALLVLALAGLQLGRPQESQSQSFRFELVEATIADVHRAIQQGQITCRGLVEAYIARARAYSSPSDRLVTADGKPIPPAQGKVLAGSAVDFPTETVAISSLLPDYGRYAGPPFDFGRLEPTSSDPEVRQQYGMTVGTDGRASNCRVTEPSPDPEADRITCRLAVERFRFKPATDAIGNPVPATYGWRQRWF